MTTESLCQCGRPIGSTAALCTDCRRTLEIALANIAAYHADLDTVRTRRTRYGDASGGVRTRGREVPMPIAEAFVDWTNDAADADSVTHNTLTTWARFVEEHVSVGYGPVCGWPCLHVSCARIRRSRPARNTVTDCCRYLLGWSDWLRTAPQGPEALDELLYVERLLRRVVDRPADRLYLGPCSGADGGVSCGQPLYADPGAPTARCRTCGTEVDVDSRRTQMLKLAEDELLPASVIARAVLILGAVDGTEQKLTDRIRKWADPSRQRLKERGQVYVGGVVRPVYRVGDVLDQLAEDARRAQTRGPRGRMSA